MSDSARPGSSRAAPARGGRAGTRCGFCTAAVVWAPDPTGRRVALDAEPTPDGTVVLYPRAGQPEMAVTLTRAAAAGHRASGRPTYRPHESTCPYARQWSAGAAAPGPTGRRP